MPKNFRACSFDTCEIYGLKYSEYILYLLQMLVKLYWTSLKYLLSCYLQSLLANLNKTKRPSRSDTTWAMGFF